MTAIDIGILAALLVFIATIEVVGFIVLRKFIDKLDLVVGVANAINLKIWESLEAMAQCPVCGAISLAGTMCEDLPFTCPSCASSLHWILNTKRKPHYMLVEVKGEDRQKDADDPNKLQPEQER